MCDLLGVDTIMTLTGLEKPMSTGGAMASIVLAALELQQIKSLSL